MPDEPDMSSVLDEYDSLIMNCKISDDENDNCHEGHTGTPSASFITSFGSIDGYAALSILQDQSTHNLLTRLSTCNNEKFEVYLNSRRYSSDIFQGIVIDTGAAKWSTAGHA